MGISLIVLTILIILLMFGAGQRILDRMRMSDKWALIIMVAIVIGIIIPPIRIGENFSFSIGGFLIPLGICIYLMVRAGWSWDLFRAVVGIFVTAGVVLGIQYLMPSTTPQDLVIENTLLYGAAAGIVAYVLGRSRRNAFICSVLGLTLALVIQFLINLSLGVMTPLNLGVSGAFDTIIIATLISVGLAELIGKTIESFSEKENKAFSFEAGEFVETHNKSNKGEDDNA